MITLFPMRYLSRHSLGRVIHPLLSIVIILYDNWNHQVLVCVSDVLVGQFDLDFEGGFWVFLFFMLPFG